MLRLENRPCCPVPRHPPLPEIRAGLTALPRQLVGFPEYRRAMLAAVSNPAPLMDSALTPLLGWKADGAHDLGVMLIEAWAYVLDITGFYDGIVAARAYLGTAADDEVVREIVALLGYVPRPAMVSRVQIAIEAKGEDMVVAPAATGFRSEAFGDEPPQVFELATSAEIWPQRNRWTVAPIRLDAYDGTLRFRPGVAPSVGAIVAVATDAGDVLAAGRVATVETTTEADSLKYQTVSFESGPLAIAAGTPLSTLRADAYTMRVGLSPLVPRDEAIGDVTGGKFAILDALYPQIGRRGAVIVEVDGVLTPAPILAVTRHDHVQPSGDPAINITIPLTRIDFEYGGSIAEEATVFLHLVPRRIGRPTRRAETEVTVDLIRNSRRLEGPVQPLGSAPWSGEAVAVGGKAAGALLSGTVTIAADGAAEYVVDASAGAFAEPLLTPVQIHGNVVEAIRGETVGHEVLGSGDAAVASQRFTLRKKPLSWIEDAAQGLGRAPQLTLRVDGLAWTYVESFYDRKRDERIYRIEMASDGTATVVLGDGVHGARAPSGVSNITASYRFGAGAAKPPAGSIKQFKRAAPGLSRVLGPLASSGGADAESAAEMGSSAASAMLSLGRAVSLADFEAMARSYSGVANAAVAYSWDAQRREAAVMVWIISEGGDPSGALADYLAGRAVPGLHLRVAPATAVVVPVFDVTVDAAEGYSPDSVREAVRTALFDPLTGLLCSRRIAIAAPLFRSHLLAAIHAVAGVKGVRSIMTSSGEMPKAMTVAEGEWLDFLTHGQVL